MSEREELIGIIEVSDMNMNNDTVIRNEIERLADAILEWHRKNCPKCGFKIDKIGYCGCTPEGFNPLAQTP